MGHMGHMGHRYALSTGEAVPHVVPHISEQAADMGHSRTRGRPGRGGREVSGPRCSTPSAESGNTRRDGLRAGVYVPTPSPRVPR